MKNKSYLLILTVFILFPLTLSADEIGNISSMNETGKTSNSGMVTENFERENRAVLASTNINYPVTPGDIYALSYIQAGTLINLNCIVNSDYSLNLGVIGEMDGSGKSFSELKKDIKKKVDWAFPDSYPDVNIISTGVFEVFLTGEVKRSKLVNAWGLTRLSDIVTTNSTDYTSVRDIIITDQDGNSNQYDLYKAWYDGDLSQNPLLAPGSDISFNQYSRKVTISGEVKRPGTYQILEGENLSELLSYYANDFTDKAYKERLIIHQSVSPDSESGGDTHYIDYKFADTTPLLNKDNVTVRTKDIFLPVFYLEGAAGIMNAQDKGTQLTSSNIIPLNFTPNSRLSTLLISHRSLFSEVSDLENSYYIKKSNREIVAIDIADILYDYNLEKDLIIESGDRLIIPFKQQFVTVNGAVENPGRYPYVPDKGFDYYVNLAGGFDTLRNSGEVVAIYDDERQRRDVDEKIEQEDVITAETNSFTYALREYSPLITAVTSIAAIVVSVISLTQ